MEREREGVVEQCGDLLEESGLQFFFLLFVTVNRLAAVVLRVTTVVGRAREKMLSFN
jgi:hypothetical protein